MNIKPLMPQDQYHSGPHNAESWRISSCHVCEDGQVSTIHFYQGPRGGSEVYIGRSSPDLRPHKSA